MEKLDKKVSELIITSLRKAVAKSEADGILLSGGVDSSILAVLAHEKNPNLVAITVVRDKKTSSDAKYAKMLSKKIGIKKHYIVTIEENEIEKLVKKVALSLEIFNVYWVAAGLVIHKGLSFAKKIGLKKVLTGEGSDDLFGSFPVMQTWRYSEKELMKFIDTRMKDIDVMTDKISKGLGIKISLPFHDKDVKKISLGLPPGLRTKKFGNEKITKYPLRESFKEMLPEKIKNRPQTMAFTGASTFEYLMEKFKGEDIKKFEKKYGITFKSSFECYLFKIINASNKYKPCKKGASICIYCGSKLRSADSVHCCTCGTLQYKGEILPF